MNGYGPALFNRLAKRRMNTKVASDKQAKMACVTTTHKEGYAKEVGAASTNGTHSTIMAIVERRAALFEKMGLTAVMNSCNKAARKKLVYRICHRLNKAVAQSFSPPNGTLIKNGNANTKAMDISNLPLSTMIHKKEMTVRIFSAISILF